MKKGICEFLSELSSGPELIKRLDQFEEFLYYNSPIQIETDYEYGGVAVYVKGEFVAWKNSFVEFLLEDVKKWKKV